ncbi:MAG TPA: ComF family protein [Woeseiaceae bacterium]|nr:ComF family protein [Woeseiaceae bacterium]
MFGTRGYFRRSAGAVIRLAFPDRCVFCAGEALGYFCVACRCSLPRIGRACARCGQPVRVRLAEGIECADCQSRPPPFYRARSAVLYSFPVDAALKALKFGHALYYAPAFSELLLAELLQHFQDADALLPVPLHHWRHSLRGFNQAVELCKPLSRRTGLPLLRNVRRVRRTRPQSGLDRAARRRNVKDAFAVTGRLHCRRPLIVDDVMTTGETCRQLARELLDAGAVSVGVLTVARASPVH